MGNSDLVYLLFPFVLSLILVLAIILCCLKCKLLVDHPHGKTPSPTDDPTYGNLINIQEYAENQIGTTIVYAESPSSSTPHPYVYFTDGHTATIVPIQPTMSGSMNCLSARTARTPISNNDGIITSSVSISPSQTRLSNVSSPPPLSNLITNSSTNVSRPTTTSIINDEGNNEQSSDNVSSPITLNNNIHNSSSSSPSPAPQSHQPVTDQIQSVIVTTQIISVSQVQRVSTNVNRNDAIIPIVELTKKSSKSDPPPSYEDCMKKSTTN